MSLWNKSYSINKNACLYITHFKKLVTTSTYKSFQTSKMVFLGTKMNDKYLIK